MSNHFYIRNVVDMVKLSVIIPVYNTPQDLLEHCLSSIKDNISNMEGVEILLLNDGSTEPYVEQMLKEIEKEDSRFKYILKKNSGASDTRNVGIESLKGNTSYLLIAMIS